MTALKPRVEVLSLLHLKSNVSMLKMAKMTSDNHKKKIKLKSNPRFLLKITTKSFETITKSNKMTTKRHKTYKLFQN